MNKKKVDEAYFWSFIYKSTLSQVNREQSFLLSVTKGEDFHLYSYLNSKNIYTRHIYIADIKL